MAGKNKSAKGNRGFNSPFAALKKRPAAVTPPTAPPKPAPSAAPARQTGLSDAELFEQAMRGTQPLAAVPHKVAGPKPEPKILSDDEQLALAELEDLVQGKGVFRVQESEEMYTGLAPGVSYQLLDSLQAGQFAYHRHLDLHGYTRDAAHTELARFVASARRAGERCVLVVTGRGKSSPNGLSVLRDAMPRWLSRAPLRPHVLAFCTARSVDGGPGAFYLLLRRPGVKPFGV